MFLLDTDIVIWITRKRQDVIEAIEKLSKSDKLSISTITIAEVYAGIFPKETEGVKTFLDSQEIIQVNREIAQLGGLYWNEHIKRFKNISLPDCIVAATAKIESSTLITLNTKHFPMQNIKIQNPLKS